MKMTKQAFLTGINYKFLCFKIVANTNQKNWGWEGVHIDWKLKLKKNELRWSGGSLCLFKLCDKYYTNFISTVFGCKTLLSNKLLSKVSLQDKDIFFCCVKCCGSKYNFCDSLWLTENLCVISMLENIKSTEMNNY